MAATILTHPRLDADSRDRLTERLCDLLAQEEILRRQAAPEAEAAYWQLFGDLEGRLPGRTPSVVGTAERRAVRRTRARIDAAHRRSAQRSMPAHARRVFVLAHRRTVRRLHPVLDPAAEAHGHLWRMVQRACRDGDLAQLHACETEASGHPAPVALDQPTLRRALAETQARIRRLEGGFPLNLRARMADASWVSRRRAALRDRLPATAADAASVRGSDGRPAQPRRRA